MKYLYKILRLFFCPHKYILEREVNAVDKEINEIPSYRILVSQCKYCGDYKKFKIK